MGVGVHVAQPPSKEGKHAFLVCFMLNKSLAMLQLLLLRVFSVEPELLEAHDVGAGCHHQSHDVPRPLPPAPALGLCPAARCTFRARKKKKK